MKPTERISWGVIGLGSFGEVHVETLTSMPGVNVSALCTRRVGRLAELADRHKVTQRYTDYRELLADASVDVVTVATHVADHRDITIDALRAGKHVFLEKPMASSVAECTDICAAAEQTNRCFMVGHICRFDPRVALAKQAMDEGRIGKIISMHARRNLSKKIGREHLDKISALAGDGIHDVDLMLWFSGAKPVSVYAQEIHPGTCKYADAGWAMIRLEGGAVGVVESIWHLPETTPYAIDARMEIIGTDGAIYINCAEAGLAIHDSSGAQLPDTLYWPYSGHERFGILRAELRYFANCVLEGRTPTRITPREACAAVALINAAADSSQTGNVVHL